MIQRNIIHNGKLIYTILAACFVFVIPAAESTTLGGAGAVGGPRKCPSEGNGAGFRYIDDETGTTDFDVLVEAENEAEARQKCAEWVNEYAYPYYPRVKVDCDECPKGTKGTTGDDDKEYCTPINLTIKDQDYPNGGSQAFPLMKRPRSGTVSLTVFVFGCILIAKRAQSMEFRVPNTRKSLETLPQATGQRLASVVPTVKLVRQSETFCLSDCQQNGGARRIFETLNVISSAIHWKIRLAS